MRKLVIAIVFGVFAGGTAQAADFPVKAVLHPAPLVFWGGLYGGAHLGAAWGYFRPDPILPGPTDVAGHVTFGGHIGYNWQAGRVVYGIEADSSWISIVSKSVGARFEENWMATVRGRLGYTFEDYLLYISGGIGFTHVETAVFGVGAASAVRTGFAGGLGVERRFSPQWSGRLETLLVDVPRRSYNNGGFITNGGSHNYIVRGALNYWF